MKRAGVAGEQLKVLMRKLTDDLAEIRKYKAIPNLTIKEGSLLEVEPPVSYYHDLESLHVLQVWRQRLNVEVACNVWSWARNCIPLEENLYAERISDILMQTFVVAASQTWELVIAPPLETQRMMGR